MSNEIAPKELCERYEALYTGVVTDVLDAMGYRDQVISNNLSLIGRNQTFAGFAFPVIGRTNQSVDYDRQIRRFLEMIGDVPEHSVLAIEANDTKSAQIGELTTTALQAQGCRGVITDGGIRDTEFVLDQDFPVYYRYLTPAESLYRWDILEWGKPAVVDGVKIAPGDVIIGDIDGVTIVPDGLAEEVLRNAEEKRDTENKVRKGIKEGMTPIEAYEEYRVF